MATLSKKFAMILEFLLVFGGLPLLVLALKDRGFMIMLAWSGAVIVYFVLHRWYERSHAAEWNWAGFKKGWALVVIRFACIAPVITGGAWFLFSGTDQFLSLPRDRPEIWIRVMLLYPLLSVWPQEIIYRSFLHHRYAPVFGKSGGFIAASAIAFGFLHIIFLNPAAVILTVLGGILFASSYLKHHSLALACLEHALYGCLIFTLGLGRFFFSGAAWG